MADLSDVALQMLPSCPQSTPTAVSNFQDIYQHTPFQPSLIRQIEEVGQDRQAERGVLEQLLAQALTSDSAGQSASTPLKMRAVTWQVAEMNVKSSLTVKTVSKTVDALNQLSRGGG